mmetsp:Transcript_7735/g.11261  ORF Transcript_7735/g.11261 Transcript_7735/m.11261 type:complete len:366 (+) Transcript_7735:44-1141(+)
MIETTSTSLKNDTIEASATPKNPQHPMEKNEINNNNDAAKPSTWTVKQTPQDSSFVPTLGVFLFLGWNGILVFLILYTGLVATKTQRSVIIGLSTLSLVLPRGFPGKLGFKAGNWFMFQSAKYFGLKTVLEDENAIGEIKDKAAIFACEPHDIIPYYAFAFNPILKRLPGHHGERNSVLVTSALFMLPFIRHVYTWVRANRVDKTTFLGNLKKGESFCFIPGGVQEVMFMEEADDNEVILYLQKRKGFVKLALETGSPIVPVYCFGVAGSYGHWIPKGDFFNKLGRAIGFLPLIYWGRFGIPYGIPKPCQLTVVFGAPIDVPLEGGNVSKESVDKYHCQYLMEMEALFDRHKGDVGCGHMKLKIM